MLGGEGVVDDVDMETVQVYVVEEVVEQVDEEIAEGVEKMDEEAEERPRETGAFCTAESSKQQEIFL